MSTLPVPPPGPATAPARTAVLCLVLLASFTLVPDCRAQGTYKSVNGMTAIVPRGSGFVSIEFAEVRFGVVATGEVGERLTYSVYAAGAARQGEPDIFAGVNFNPGLDAGIRAAYLFGESGERYDLAFLIAGFSSTERKLISFSDDSTTAMLSEDVQRDLVFGLGANHGFGVGTVLGLGLFARREFASPGAARAREVCTRNVQPGTNVVVPVCTNRYLVPLADQWAGHARADLAMRLVRLGAAEPEPVLTLLTGSSVDIREDATAALNLGVGLAIATGSYPGMMVVGVFGELYDALDANAQAPNFGDRFVTRVAIALPFAMLR